MQYCTSCIIHKIPNINAPLRTICCHSFTSKFDFKCVEILDFFFIRQILENTAYTQLNNNVSHNSTYDGYCTSPVLEVITALKQCFLH